MTQATEAQIFMWVFFVAYHLPTKMVEIILVELYLF